MTPLEAPVPIVVDKSTVWPWQAEPHRLWSLLEMKTFDFSNSAACIADAGGSLKWVEQSKALLDRFKQLRVHDDRVVEIEGQLHTDITESIQHVVDSLKDVSLSEALKAMLRMALKAAEDGDTQKAHTLGKAFITSLLIELRSQLFLRVDPEKRELYEQISLFGDQVATTFPDAEKDVAAAGRCLALDEWTACVFHLMRVLEHGLRPLAARFDVPFAVDSWHRVIKGIEDGIAGLRNKQGLTQADRDEITQLSEAASQFRYFKDAWRNHVSHARSTYDEREAQTIWNHVKEFMQHMATIV